MRIKSIELCWFRGAATKTVLNADCKSVVIYGDNACGKSSFVDAFEYILANGRIEHLSHEYSEPNHRNCVRNTETPADEECTAKVCFEKNDYIQVQIPEQGPIQFESNRKELLEEIHRWDVKQHILRQDEVAEFIRESKSKKYSALSPLLGLQPYEDVANNITKIQEAVLKRSKYEKLQTELEIILKELKQFFPSMTENEFRHVILNHAKKYVLSSEDEDIELISKKASSELSKRLQDKEPEVKRHAAIQNIVKLKLEEKFKLVSQSEEQLSQSNEEFVENKIPILENASTILNSIADLDKDLECPACGQFLSGLDFKAHVDKELELLKNAREARDVAITQKRDFISAVLTAKHQYQSEKSLSDWLSSPEKSRTQALIETLFSLKLEDPIKKWSTNSRNTLRTIIDELIPLLVKEVSVEPPTTKEILYDYTLFQAASKIPRFKSLEASISKIDLLISELDESHALIRTEIAKITKETLDTISSEISRIWLLIHPGQLIEDVQLIPSAETDKGIEVCLKFYGRDLLSPKLTLSEGYRNSLGLSIFLALSNQGNAKADPILLDDIVSSLDREHRGMITGLLSSELNDRQVFLFTHDNDWFNELRLRLEPTGWKFFTLKKWVSPKMGIELIPSPSTFEEAESFLPGHPNSSGNAVRGIMDTELPKAAMKLDLPMPFRQGLHNDHRMAYEFLTDFISEGGQKYKILQKDEFVPFQQALDCWATAKELLVTWANTASHGRNITEPEAKELITTCKAALAFFGCGVCGTKVWALHAPKYVRCDCGLLKWKTEL